MILFASDNHYEARPGASIYERIRNDYDIEFFEDDWSCFKQENLNSCKLLILNMIGDTCDLPHPGSDAEAAIKSYVESGKPILLLHGSSAAFWKWSAARSTAPFPKKSAPRRRCP